MAVELVNFVLYGEASSPHDEMREHGVGVAGAENGNDQLVGRKRKETGGNESIRKEMMDGITSEDEDEEEEENRGGVQSTPGKYSQSSVASKMSKSAVNSEMVKEVLNEMRDEFGNDAIVSENDLTKRLTPIVGSTISGNEMRTILRVST